MPWVDIGNRKTFLPTFVDERFDGPPYWACTFTALCMGLTVASLGRLPATHTEILALAKASGDTDLRGGSRTSHMVTAAKVRRGLTLRTDDVSAGEVGQRLARGWVLLAGCNYGKLPDHYRRWSPNFTGGHRAVLAGWSSGRSRWFDPMAAKDKTYQGEWIDWSDFAPAFWSDDQAWIIEGELMQQTITITSLFTPARRFGIRAGSTIQAYTATGPGRKGTFASGSGAHFDAAVTIAQAPDPRLVPHGGPFIRVIDGIFAGQYIAAAAVDADLAPPPVTDATLAAARLEAARAEYDRIAAGATTTTRIVLPARL